MELPGHVVDHLIDTWPVARLATQGASPPPNLVPIVFARVRGYLWSPVDGKPKSGGELARVRNVRGHPEVSLLIDHYDPSWSLLWWVRIEGVARVVQPPDPANDPDARPAVEALRRKYPQYEHVEPLRDPPTLLAIQPLRVCSWCAGAEAVPDAPEVV